MEAETATGNSRNQGKRLGAKLGALQLIINFSKAIPCLVFGWFSRSWVSAAESFDMQSVVHDLIGIRGTSGPGRQTRDMSTHMMWCAAQLSSSTH